MNKAHLSRRGFLLGSGSWLGAMGLSRGRDFSPALKTISIFHTTDLHGHIVPTETYGGARDLGGFARCASCIRQWRRDAPESLLVDVGDVYQGTAESFINRGAMMMEMFNRLGYDGWVLGNHDFDWGREALEKNLMLSKSPILTGNLQRDGKIPGNYEGAWKAVKPWILKEVGGIRVALIGLVTPGLPYWLAPETLGGFLPTDPVASMKRSIAEAKSAKADVVVVIGHMGWRNEDDFANPLREMLEKNPEVDVYLGGHSHQDKPSWELGSVLCSQASYFGIHCGRVDLTLDLESRKILSRKAYTMLMDQRYDLDPVVMEIASPEIRKASEQLSRKVGTVQNRIEGRGRGSRLITLFCEFFMEALERNQTPVDGVFHGSFGTGDLEPGPITVADCWKMLPYENLLTVAEVSAEELVEIFSEELGESKSDRALFPFDLQLDDRGKVRHFLFRGEAVAAGRRFRIAFNSYDAQSGGKRLMRLREILAAPPAKRITTPIDTRGALIDGILNRKELL